METSTDPISCNIFDQPLSPDQVACIMSAITYLDDVSTFFNTCSQFTLLFDGIETEYGNYAFIVQNTSTNVYYLAIRGSLPLNGSPTWAEFGNWFIEDFNIFIQDTWQYTNSSGSLVADGACDAFTDLLGMTNKNPSGESIDTILTTTLAANKQIVITGHSLGGNMANTYASYFKYTYITSTSSSYNNLYLFTFAAPAPGNDVFASDLDTALPGLFSTHYEVDLDVVPKFPVYSSIVDNVTTLYSPSPNAPSIDFWWFSLRDGIEGLVYPLYLFDIDYQQQRNGYKLLTGTLKKNYEQNDLGDWLNQAGCQHSIANYGELLGINNLSDLAQYTTRFKMVLGDKCKTNGL